VEQWQRDNQCEPHPAITQSADERKDFAKTMVIDAIAVPTCCVIPGSDAVQSQHAESSCG
jgi:hypothetical protein